LKKTQTPNFLQQLPRTFPQPVTASVSTPALPQPHVLSPQYPTKAQIRPRLAQHHRALRMEILISCCLRSPSREPVNKDKNSCSSCHAAPGLPRKTSPGPAPSDAGSSPAPPAESFPSA